MLYIVPCNYTEFLGSRKRKRQSPESTAKEWIGRKEDPSGFKIKEFQNKGRLTTVAFCYIYLAHICLNNGAVLQSCQLLRISRNRRICLLFYTVTHRVKMLRKQKKRPPLFNSRFFNADRAGKFKIKPRPNENLLALAFGQALILMTENMQLLIAQFFWLRIEV